MKRMTREIMVVEGVRVGHSRHQDIAFCAPGVQGVRRYGGTDVRRYGAMRCGGTERVILSGAREARGVEGPPCCPCLIAFPGRAGADSFSRVRGTLGCMD